MPRQCLGLGSKRMFAQHEKLKLKDVTSWRPDRDAVQSVRFRV